ncbi:MAG: septum formation initiator family protein [Gemmatimonadetes bacterium]|nr:septum formation initiator family protein [Gemmatimonadota bacterium]
MATTGLPRRIALGAFALGAAWFAVEGGEYGTHDLWQQRARSRELTDSVRTLSRVVDSLETYKRLVLTDPATQERIAREEFGMVKGGKELLYRFAPAAGDSAARTKPARKPAAPKSPE